MKLKRQQPLSVLVLRKRTLDRMAEDRWPKSAAAYETTGGIVRDREVMVTILEARSCFIHEDVKHKINIVTGAYCTL
jgi:hypothetical protein